MVLGRDDRRCLWPEAALPLAAKAASGSDAAKGPGPFSGEKKLKFRPPPVLNRRCPSRCGCSGFIPLVAGASEEGVHDDGAAPGVAPCPTCSPTQPLSRSAKACRLEANRSRAEGATSVGGQVDSGALSAAMHTSHTLLGALGSTWATMRLRNKHREHKG